MRRDIVSTIYLQTTTFCDFIWHQVIVTWNNNAYTIKFLLFLSKVFMYIVQKDVELKTVL